MPALLSALLPRLQTLVQALLRAARSVSPESMLRAARSAPESVLRWMRSVSLESTLRSLRSMSLKTVATDAHRVVRRPSRLALGVAAGLVIVAAVVADLSGGSSSPAAALDSGRQAAPAAAGPVGHAPAAGQAPATGGAPAAHGASAAGGAPAAGQAPAAQAPAAPSSPAAAAPSSPAAPAPSSPAPAAPSSPAPAAPAPAPAAKPYQIYDSVTPTSIPAGSGTVATYGDGAHPVPASQVEGRRSVVWISVTGQDYGASVVDVEPGNASPAAAASWAQHRLTADPQAPTRIYTYLSEWPAVKAAVATLPAQIQAHIHYWIADPTGTPHIVPGSQATQWYWGPNFDISMAAPGF